MPSCPPLGLLKKRGVMIVRNEGRKKKEPIEKERENVLIPKLGGSFHLGIQMRKEEKSILIGAALNSSKGSRGRDRRRKVERNAKYRGGVGGPSTCRKDQE